MHQNKITTAQKRTRLVITTCVCLVLPAITCSMSKVVMCFSPIKCEITLLVAMKVERGRFSIITWVFFSQCIMPQYCTFFGISKKNVTKNLPTTLFFPSFEFECMYLFNPGPHCFLPCKNNLFLNKVCCFIRDFVLRLLDSFKRLFSLCVCVCLSLVSPSDYSYACQTSFCFVTN